MMRAAASILLRVFAASREDGNGSGEAAKPRRVRA